MDKRIHDYCKHIRKAQIKVLRSDHKTHSKFWDLPAMATVCHDFQRTHFAKGYAHHPKGTRWHYLLKQELEKLGNIGDRSRIGKRYVIGNCAEQHAGNNYMNRFHENNIHHLYFTEAVRPRTMEIFPYCDNCKAVFPNL